MSHAITIDNFDVTIHERYASDREALDRKYVDDAHRSSFEIPGVQTGIYSKWEELFETNIHQHPWANFTPPPGYLMMRNRVFSYSLSSHFDWNEPDQEQEEEERENKKEKKKIVEEYKNKIKAKKPQHTPLALVEQDQKALLNLIDSINNLNGLLEEIHGRKLQYQKG